MIETYALSDLRKRLSVPVRALRQVASSLGFADEDRLTLPEVVGLMVVTAIAADDGFRDSAAARRCFDAVLARLSTHPDGHHQVVRVELDQVFVGDLDDVDTATSTWRRGRAHEISLDNFLLGALDDLA